MTDQQILTLALSVIIPISLSIAALIYSNSRITEAKETLRAEIKAEATTLRADVKTENMALRAHFDASFRDLANQLHEEIKLLTGKVIEIDNRLSRIENRLGPPR